MADQLLDQVRDLVEGQIVSQQPARTVKNGRP